MNILITGATGNVGRKTLKAIFASNRSANIIAGLRDVEKDQLLLQDFPTIEFRQFDFDKIKQFEGFLKGIDRLFLLRPPHISNTKKYFQPLVDVAVREGVGYIVFLSVQGADKSSFIPHHKIERMIVECGIPYCFLRPAYFMQNFTTTLLNDIRERKEVYLPAGKAKFTLVDLLDVGKVAAEVLLEPQEHQNVAYDLTNDEQLDFAEMCHQLSEGIGRKIQFRSPYLLSFFNSKRKEGTPILLILVMIMLHYLPRFRSVPPCSDWIRKITKQKPVSFSEFVFSNKAIWISQP